MRTAVEDVHHGDGQGVATHTAKVAVELLARLLRGSLGGSQRDTQNGIGTQTALVLCAVKFYHLHVEVEGFLLADKHALQLVVQNSVHIVHGLHHAFAEEEALVAIAKLASLVHARGGTARNSSAAHGALVGIHIDFNCGVSATVENLTALDSYYLTHSYLNLNYYFFIHLIEAAKIQKKTHTGEEKKPKQQQDAN